MKRLIIGIATAAMLFGAAPAHAEPGIDGKTVVCGTFDEYGVTSASVKSIGAYLVGQGQRPGVAVTVIVLSTHRWCPQYDDALTALG